MKLGFLLSSLGDSDLVNNFIKNANVYLEHDDKSDIIAFVNNQVKPKTFPVFSSMNINEAFDFDGIAVATDLDTAEKLAQLPGPKGRYYYLWELDWTKKSDRSFEQLMDLFHNPKLTLIARSEDDKRIIEKCWNCRVKSVIPDFNVRTLIEMIRNNEN